MAEWGVWFPYIGKWLVSDTGSIVHASERGVMVAECRELRVHDWDSIVEIRQFGPDGLPLDVGDTDAWETRQRPQGPLKEVDQ